METIVYFFSGTGNSRKTAESIAARLENARAVPIGAASLADFSGSDAAVGFVFPILMFGVPTFVLSKMRAVSAGFAGSSSKRYVFAVATHGGNPAASCDQIDRALKLKRKRVAHFSLEIPRKKFDADAYERRVSEISTFVGERRLPPFDSPRLSSRLLTVLVNPMGNAFMNPKFSAGASCVGCGACARLCPTGNISMIGGKPSWGKKCDTCFGCVNWCPSAAITGKMADAFRYRSPLASSAEELFVR